jgi:Ribbon-helix-helix protein, copG family
MLVERVTGIEPAWPAWKVDGIFTVRHHRSRGQPRGRTPGITSGIIIVMAMTLRLDDGETEALRERAEYEGRSMQEVARQAVREYVERTSRRDLLDRVLDEELPRYAEALRRLGE